MRLTLPLPADVAVALRRYAELEGIEIELAGVIAMREWLIHVGYLVEEPEMEEDAPTERTA
ncbi:MAG TPA: hypothetical protein VGN97_12225 [Mesorhizobium sp.]|jgi:hypothetical protein|nr:hypothetical protein [Mesorhizobium sp.]